MHAVPSSATGWLICAAQLIYWRSHHKTPPVWPHYILHLSRLGMKLEVSLQRTDSSAKCCNLLSCAILSLQHFERANEQKLIKYVGVIRCLSRDIPYSWTTKWMSSFCLRREALAFDWVSECSLRVSRKGVSCVEIISLSPQIALLCSERPSCPCVLVEWSSPLDVHICVVSEADTTQWDVLHCECCVRLCLSSLLCPPALSCQINQLCQCVLTLYFGVDSFWKITSFIWVNDYLLITKFL